MKLINSTLVAIFYKILINVWLKLNQLFVSKKFGINLIEKKSDYSIFEYYRENRIYQIRVKNSDFKILEYLVEKNYNNRYMITYACIFNSNDIEIYDLTEFLRSIVHYTENINFYEIKQQFIDKEIQLEECLIYICDKDLSEFTYEFKS